jgi:hypothetical protein
MWLNLSTFSQAGSILTNIAAGVTVGVVMVATIMTVIVQSMTMTERRPLLQ